MKNYSIRSQPRRNRDVATRSQASLRDQKGPISYIGSSDLQDNSSDDCAEDTRRYVLRLPFVQNTSLAFAKKLQDILLRKLDVKIDVVYKSCKLSMFFSLR